MLSLTSAIFACDPDCLALAKSGPKKDFTLCTDLTGCPLSRLDLSGAKMQGVDLSGAELNGTKMEFTDLTGADMTAVVMYGAKLKGAIMTGASLMDADAQNCDFENAMLNGEQSGRASLAGADFTGSKFNGAVLKAADATGTDFTSCTFPKASFEGMIVVDTIFKKADLKQALITDIAGESAIFDRADMTGVTITDANFTSASFRYTKMNNINFEDVKLFLGADFTGAQLENLILADSVFENAILKDANLQYASGEDLVFSGANLDGANLRYARLADSKFINVKARGAIFDEAFLEAANFEKAKMKGASFRKANINRANFKKARLNKADFTDVIGGANVFCGSILTRAKFDRAQVKESYFGTLCDFESADTLSKGAKLAFARFNDADISKANFCGAIGLDTIAINSGASTVDTKGLPGATGKQSCDYSEVSPPPPPPLTYEYALYKSSGKKSWADAKAECEKLDNGGLASILSPGQNAVVQELVKDISSVWIGGTDQPANGKDEEGKWIWSLTKTEVKYFNWEEGKPNNAVKDCMLFKGQGATAGKWLPLSCDAMRYFVCQYAA